MAKKEKKDPRSPEEIRAEASHPHSTFEPLCRLCGRTPEWLKSLKSQYDRLTASGIKTIQNSEGWTGYIALKTEGDIEAWFATLPVERQQAILSAAQARKAACVQCNGDQVKN